MSATWGKPTMLAQRPDVVWAFLASEANDVSWRAPWVRSVRKLTPGPPGVGTRYETNYLFFGRPERTIVEITEFDPPRRMAWRQLDSDTIVSNIGSPSP
jgi:hypothetical protein